MAMAILALVMIADSFGFETKDKRLRGSIMEVILLEKIANLGALGDRVTVKAGYGRNYLIPQAKAVAATATTLKLSSREGPSLKKKRPNSVGCRARATAVAP